VTEPVAVTGWVLDTSALVEWVRGSHAMDAWARVSEVFGVTWAVPTGAIVEAGWQLGSSLIGDSPLWEVLRRGMVLPVLLAVEDATRLLVYGKLWSAAGQPPFDLVRGHARLIATERRWRIITDDPDSYPELDVNPLPDEGV
jgi:predicted nucleic acid-binding protein